MVPPIFGNSRLHTWRLSGFRIWGSLKSSCNGFSWGSMKDPGFSASGAGFRTNPEGLVFGRLSHTGFWRDLASSRIKKTLRPITKHQNPK